jgi:integrase
MPTDLRATFKTLAVSSGQAATNYFDDVSAPAFGLSGLALRVYASGKRTWFITYYNSAGKKCRYTIGRADVLNYFAARKEAEKRLAEAKTGNDPVERRRTERLEQSRRDSGADSFAGLATAYLRGWAALKKRERSIAEDTRQINRVLIPEFGKRDARDITRMEVRAVLRRIGEDEDHPVAANRLQALLSKIFNYAINEGFLTANPIARMEKIYDETNRTRWLQDSEVSFLWNELERGGYERDFSDAWKVALLTALRRTEVLGLRWSEIDLAEGIISLPAKPSERAPKNGQALELPLLGLAYDIIAARSEMAGRHHKYVFPNMGGTDHLKHISDGVGGLQAALRKEFKIADEDEDYDDPTVHDLRRTCATGLARLGVNPVVIEQIQNHKLKGQLAVYVQHQYGDEKRDALELWDAGIRRVIEGLPLKEPRNNVRKMREVA